MGFNVNGYIPKLVRGVHGIYIRLLAMVFCSAISQHYNPVYPYR